MTTGWLGFHFLFRKAIASEIITRSTKGYGHQYSGFCAPSSFPESVGTHLAMNS